ncbi:MAG: Golgi apparatus membrane protein tvp23 [Candelina mexicana]|nr:MAG: Golgi apparatus membrane protein tvp23 [Candelina mexicana]
MENPPPGSLSWRLSAHPITLLCFLGFRSGTSNLTKRRKGFLDFPALLGVEELTIADILRPQTASLLVYLFGVLFTSNLYPYPPHPHSPSLLKQRLTPLLSVLIFIITILLLAADFYYIKNIAGRRLVGLRWWNEVDVQSGDSHWVFESSDPNTKIVNATDSRFFWLALYIQPLLWVGLAVVALVRFKFIWLSLVGLGSRKDRG